MKRIIFFSLLIIASISKAFPQQSRLKLSGLVFEDKNQNKVKDSNEKGIRGIPVSNGDTLILTDNKGRFLIPVVTGCSVFPIPPSKYTINGNGTKNSHFFYVTNKKKDDKLKSIEFPLVKQVKEDKFRIAAVGDVQVGNEEEINYANKTIISELAGRKDIKFSLFLGDLINDKSDLLPHLYNMIETIPTPTWTVFGNHDREVSANYQDSVYNSIFGASHYSFNYGDVHFIVLNNIYTNKKAYHGRISERQMRFIKNDLMLVPKNHLVVINQHIPMFYTKNKDEVLKLLKDREQVLILSGHTHKVGRHILSNNITEIIAGTSCGNWWRGEVDWRGVPNALMQCGSPRNYFLIDFEGNEFKMAFKGVGLDKKKQMDIWVSRDDTLYQSSNNLKSPTGREVIANIFAGCDSTVVKMKVDSGNWIKMEKRRILDPNVHRMKTWHKEGGYPNKYSKRGALRRSPSSHIWVGYLPETLKKGIHHLVIDAQDNYGLGISQHRIFLK